MRQRKSIRLQGYDYTKQGAYFVTICSHNRESILGEIVSGEMRLNENGIIVRDTWEWLGNQYSYVGLDEYVTMPNHFHGIILIDHDRGDGSVGCADDSRRGASRGAPTTGTPTTGAPTIGAPTIGAPTIGAPTTKIKPLGQLIGAFKTVSSKRINLLRNTPGALLWQRNYYEHVIRDETDLQRIREYIANNPSNWADDTNDVPRNDGGRSADAHGGDWVDDRRAGSRAGPTQTIAANVAGIMEG